MTLAYDYAGTTRGFKQTIPSYVVATGNDTTATVAGPAISNAGGGITRICFGQVTTASTGTSPTLTTKLQGSIDGTTWFDVLDSGAAAITTTALSISSAASEFEDTNQEGISQFPPYIRTYTTVGGSNTPGWTGKILLDIDRQPMRRLA